MVDAYSATVAEQVNSAARDIANPAENSGGYAVDIGPLPLAPTRHEHGERRLWRARWIVNYVSAEYGIDPDEVYRKGRNPTLAEARHVCCWLIRNAIRPQLSFPEIGRLLGGRDHTTIMSAVSKIDRRRTSEAEMRGTIGRLLVAVCGERAAMVDGFETGRFG